MLPYSFTIILHQRFQKTVYAGREMILHKTRRRQPQFLGHHLNLPLMPNSNHVSIGENHSVPKLLSKKSNIETNQLTCIVDQCAATLDEIL